MNPDPKDLDIFWLDTGRDSNLAQDFAPLLCTQERDRAARYLAPRDRSRYIMRRGALRHNLAQRLKIAPACIGMDQTPLGKPFIADSDIKFSCAHSRDIALFAVASGMELGCDIEIQNAALASRDVAVTMFSQEALMLLDAMPPSDWAPGFFQYWTLLEATMKARGTGFLLDEKPESTAKPDFVHRFQPKDDYHACVVAFPAALDIRVQVTELRF